MKYGSEAKVGCHPVVAARKPQGVTSPVTKKGKVVNDSTTSKTGDWTKGGPYRPQSPMSSGGG